MFRAIALAVLSVLLATAGKADTFLGPTPYLSSLSSPFAGGAFTYFYLEDFEDGSLNTPGVTVTAGTTINGPASLTDSVDADDGTIDGSGTAGSALYSGNVLSVFRFNFDAAALGGLLPSHAGIVWTDVGQTSGTPGVGGVIFEAFDSLGVSLGLVGPFTLGDGAASGGTAEDRFFGIIHAAGISAIEIRMDNSTDWEADHLQYGFLLDIPEPESWPLVVAAMLAIVALRTARARR